LPAGRWRALERSNHITGDISKVRDVSKIKIIVDIYTAE